MSDENEQSIEKENPLEEGNDASTKPSFGREVMLNAMLMATTFIVCCLIAEIGLRIHYASKVHTFELDERRGWRTVPNLDVEVDVEDFAGVSSSVNIQTDANGFRAYDSEDDGRPRVLIIGDSFTFGKDVSQKNTYYAHLQDSLDAAFFVYGGEGYNTLQEFFVLDDYIDIVKPDLVILQFCWNDFIGNNPELERLSVINNNGYRRPYPTESGDVVYRNPKGSLHTFSLKWSRLLYSLVYRADAAFQWSVPETTAEESIDAEGAAHDGLRRSALATAAILKTFKERCGDVPVLAFAIDDLEPYHALTLEVCDAAGIEYLPGLGEALRISELGGQTTKAGDGAHWNALGHEVCADFLAESLVGRLDIAN